MNSARFARASGASAAGAKPTASKPRRSASSRMAILIAALMPPRSPPPAIGRDTLIREPHAAGRRARLIEDFDRHAAARIPVAADADPLRLQRLDEAARDGERAILVKSSVIAEGAEVKLQRLAFDKKAPWHVVDHEMGEIRLTRDGAKRGEFGTGEAHEIGLARMRVRHLLEHGVLRRRRQRRLAAELRQIAVDRFRHRALMLARLIVSRAAYSLSAEMSPAACSAAIRVATSASVPASMAVRRSPIKSA